MNSQPLDDVWNVISCHESKVILHYLLQSYVKISDIYGGGMYEIVLCGDLQYITHFNSSTTPAPRDYIMQAYFLLFPIVMLSLEQQSSVYHATIKASHLWFCEQIKLQVISRFFSLVMSEIWCYFQLLMLIMLIKLDAVCTYSRNPLCIV